MSIPSHHFVSRRALLQGSGALLISACARAGKAPAEWPCFRGPNRTGVLDERLALRVGGPARLWEAEVGHGNASMAVSGGRLYTMGVRPGTVACLNAANGRPIWQRELETHFQDSTPSVQSGRVYGLTSLGSGSATAFCCSAASGEVLWKRELPTSTGDRQYGHAGSTLLWEDLVIVNAGAGAALKKTSGEVAWVHPGFPGLATPVLFSSRGVPSVVLFGGDRCIAREARTGRELWQIPWKTELAVNACDPIIFDNKVFLCSDYGRGRSLYDISGSRPRLLWEFGAGRGSSFSTGFHHEGELYCFAESSFCCLDSSSGQPRWRIPGANSALLIGDTLILVRHAGEMRFGRLSPGGFQQLATADAGMRDLKAVPAYSNGRLYLRSESGKVACFQIGTPA